MPVALAPARFASLSSGPESPFRLTLPLEFANPLDLMMEPKTRAVAR